MKIGWLLLILPWLAACSLYESDGRKFLEAGGLEFAGVAAQANLSGCGRVPSNATWVLLEQKPLADVYAIEGENYQMRVIPASDTTFSCYFQFSSAQELYEKTAAAVDLTMSELNSPPKGR